ncbi:MAG: hypothetical protein ACFB10_15825 [Salibacteraceae bacterium]
MNRVLPLILLIGLFCSAFQPLGKEKGITAKQTVEYLNSKIDPSVRMALKKGGVMVSFMKGEFVFRQDLFYPEDFDVSTVKYVAEEEAFSMKCFKGSKCVDRNLIEQDIRRGYSRLAIPFDGDEKAREGVRQALIHLLRNAQENDYSRTEPFE